MSEDVGGAVRLVVSDVDGTLVDHDKQLHAATTEAVGRLRRAGIAFTIISARPMSGMLPIAEALDINAPMAAFNGGTIFRRDGSVIARHVIDPAVVRAMFDLARGLPLNRWLFADGLWHADDKDNSYVARERIASDQEPLIVSDFEYLFGRTDKLTFISDDHGLLDELQSRASELKARATIAKSQPYYLDVTALEANKGDGIARLTEAMDVPLLATAAIGDQANDIPMLTRAGLSIAMAQGPQAVRDAANFVTASNEADGVALAIDEMILPTLTRN